MPEWKILLCDGLDGAGQAILRQTTEVHDRDGIKSDELLEIVGDYAALVVRGRTRVTEQVFAAAGRLKVVGRAGVGVDNIDLVSARERGILVVNAARSTSIAVAELALGLMLALARSLPAADASMKRGEWQKKAFHGIELNGKTLGVIGMGNIGREVAARGAALGMQVLGYDPLLEAVEITRRGGLPSTLDDLYPRSDFITIHVPLTPISRNLIDRAAIEKMKPGVRIICTARGGIITEEALLAGLESGKVTGAALDVFAQEPPGLTALITHPLVIAAPHIGAQTIEAQARAATDIAQEVLAALRGEPLRWRVA